MDPTTEQIADAVRNRMSDGIATLDVDTFMQPMPDEVFLSISLELKRLFDAFPTFKPNEGTVTTWADALWRHVPQIVELLPSAVDSVMVTDTFYPSLAGLIGSCESERTAQSKQARSSRRPACGRCSGSLWVEETNDAGVNVVRGCEFCSPQWQPTQFGEEPVHEFKKENVAAAATALRDAKKE